MYLKKVSKCNDFKFCEIYKFILISTMLLISLTCKTRLSAQTALFENSQVNFVFFLFQLNHGHSCPMLFCFFFISDKKHDIQNKISLQKFIRKFEMNNNASHDICL